MEGLPHLVKFLPVNSTSHFTYQTLPALPAPDLDSTKIFSVVKAAISFPIPFTPPRIVEIFPQENLEENNKKKDPRIGFSRGPMIPINGVLAAQVTRATVVQEVPASYGSSLVRTLKDLLPGIGR